MKYVIECENIKCGGCANTIKSKLIKITSVSDVAIEIEEGRVTLNADEGLRDQITTCLTTAGYPEKGTVEGIKAATAKAKSFVSCAVGKIKD